MALRTHSASTNTRNPSGALVATAKCGTGEHVISGGYKTTDAVDVGSAVVSRAVHGTGWTVQYFPNNTDTLTTYAYCASKGAAVSKHEATVATEIDFANTTVTAACASGQTLVSGGYALSPSTPFSPTFTDAASAHRWKVTLVDRGAEGGTPATLAAFAYCMRGVKVKVRSSTGSTPANRTGSATATCHRKEALLAGGYNTTPKPDYLESTGPNSFYSASYRSAKRSWTAIAHNNSTVPGKITAYAYCMPPVKS